MLSESKYVDILHLKAILNIVGVFEIEAYLDIR